MLNVIVVDDEPAGRRALTRLIDRTPGLNLAGEADSAAGAIDLIGRCRPDAAFLDVQMAGGDGFSIVAGMVKPPKFVFVTAHANYAARAFDVEAVDFLLKPVEAHRFARTVRRLQKLLAPGAVVAPPGGGRAGLLTIPVSGGQRLVPVNDIIAVLADGDDSRLLLAGNVSMSARRSIGALSASLNAPLFQRVGRSVILNLERIDGIQTITRDSTRVILRGHGQVLMLGRGPASLLRQQVERLLHAQKE